MAAPQIPEQTNRYDQVPYRSDPFAQSHPERLATVATLLGLPTQPPERCRVLELGSAAGGNLIPMAEQLPGSSFLGIDLSNQQIQDGMRTIKELGLPNISVRQANVLDLGDGIGEFDYIICHGVFSWVPEPVQEKILSVCSKQLAPNGVAYISYNTYPGWHFRNSIRHMMLFHAGRFAGPREQIRQARAILDFLVGSVSTENNPYGAYLRSELEGLRRADDSYLFHEHLEEHNTPIHFSEFVRRAEVHGLRFLAEADLRVMVPGHFPKEVEAALQQLSPDIVYLEQYMDFLRNRTFRQTLLCKSNHQPNYRLSPKVLEPFWVAATVTPQNATPDLHSDRYEPFVSDRGITVQSRDPIVKAALVILGQTWPARVPFLTLKNQARSLLDSRAVFDAAAAERDFKVLGETILHFYTTAGTDLVELSLRRLPVARRPAERPRASGLARLQARSGNFVTNLRHEPVQLGNFEREILQRLDGPNADADLVDQLTTLVLAKKLIVQIDGKETLERDSIVKVLDTSISSQLQRFARQSLLLEERETNS